MHEHDRPMSRTQKQAAVKAALDDPGTREWSDREIARRCGVSHVCVAQWRRRLFGAESMPVRKAIYRQDRAAPSAENHKESSVKNAEKRAAVQAALTNPELAVWSDRAIAKRLGVSHAYVSKMRQRMPQSPEMCVVTAGAKARQHIWNGNVVLRQLQPTEPAARDD